MRRIYPYHVRSYRLKLTGLTIKEICRILHLKPSTVVCNLSTVKSFLRHGGDIASISYKRPKDNIKVTFDEATSKIIAWSIEWEGMISMRKKTNQLAPVVAIQCTKLELIDGFHKLVGRIGKIYGPYHRKNPNAKPLYGWKLYTLKEIRDFCEQIIPFLITKKRQAELVLEFCNLRLSRPAYNYPYTQREKNIVCEVAKLNERGVHNE
ncbi:hypothetical protein ES702_00760 [subsurface metagenome]